MYPFFHKQVKYFVNDIKGAIKNIKYIIRYIKMLNLNPDPFFIKKVKKH